MILSSYKTKTYNVGQGYKVDVVETPIGYEAWLYHQDKGIKDLMFGVPEEQQTMKEFLESNGFDIPVEKSKIPYRG